MAIMPDDLRDDLRDDLIVKRAPSPNITKRVGNIEGQR